jgi:hypothetical protein
MYAGHRLRSGAEMKIGTAPLDGQREKLDDVDVEVHN